MNTADRVINSMARRHLPYCLSILLVMATAAGCSKYENNPNVSFIEYGIINDYNPDMPDNYFILNDYGKSLYVRTNLWKSPVREQQRVKVIYDTISESLVEGRKVTDIKLHKIDVITVKHPLLQSFIEEKEGRMDSIGTDPIIGIKEMFFSGKYLNVTYVYPKRSEEMHTLGLMVNDMLAAPDGTVEMTLCHNAKDDRPTGNDTGYKNTVAEISFDLSSLFERNGKIDHLIVKWTKFDRTWDEESTKSERIAVKIPPAAL